LPYKRYQIDRIFRDEPVKSNRFREFTQCDADIIGSTLKDEAELLSMAKKILDELKIENVIYFNNRKLLNEIMVSVGIEEKNQEKVIRELDKLDKLNKKDVADALKKLGAEKVLKIIERGEFENYGSYKQIKELKKLCKARGINIEFLPTLARGLSYYNGTVFEIKTRGINETICGGGAFKVGTVQSFGFAFGLDRLSMLSPIEGDATRVQIISIDEDNEAINLANKLREKGISVNLLLDRGIGKAMEYANSKGIRKVIFIGKEEVEKKKFRVRDMKSGKEEFLGESKIIEDV